MKHGLIHREMDSTCSPTTPCLWHTIIYVYPPILVRQVQQINFVLIRLWSSSSPWSLSCCYNNTKSEHWSILTMKPTFIERIKQAHSVVCPLPETPTHRSVKGVAHCSVLCPLSCSLPALASLDFWTTLIYISQWQTPTLVWFSHTCCKK